MIYQDKDEYGTHIIFLYLFPKSLKRELVCISECVCLGVMEKKISTDPYICPDLQSQYA